MRPDFVKRIVGQRDLSCHYIALSAISRKIWFFTNMIHFPVLIYFFTYCFFSSNAVFLHYLRAVLVSLNSLEYFGLISTDCLPYKKLPISSCFFWITLEVCLDIYIRVDTFFKRFDNFYLFLKTHFSHFLI